MSRALAIRSRIQQPALPYVPLMLLGARRRRWPTQWPAYSTTAADTYSAGKDKLPASLLSSKYKVGVTKGSASAGTADLGQQTANGVAAKSAQKSSSKKTSVPSVPGAKAIPPAMSRGGRGGGRNAQSRQPTRAGKKRKAEQWPEPQPPPRHRPSQESNPPWIKYGYDQIRASITLPTLQRSKGKEPDMVLLPKSFLHNHFQGHLQFASKSQTMGQMHQQCTVTTTLPDGSSIAAIGEGRLAKEAEKAAYLHMIGKLQAVGHFSDSGLIDELSTQTMHTEKFAKLDIYNYAARFNAIPKISIEQPRLRSRRDGRVVNVTVEMAEHGIHVLGRGKTIHGAEIAAAVKFKDAAEKFHADQGTSSLVVKGPNALNADNARAFFDFYKTARPGGEISVAISAMPMSGESYSLARLSVNGERIADAVLGKTKKQTEELAHLVGAVHLVREDPSLLVEWRKAPRNASGEVLKPVLPVTMTLERSCLELMRETLASARHAGLPSKQKKMASADEVDTRRTRSRLPLAPAAVASRNATLSAALRRYQQDPKLEDLRNKRNGLPMNHYREQVLEIVNNNLYCIIIGATGSGKTTQVPQILLEQAISAGEGARCNVICTQPRRIAATSVARRVAEERAERLTESVGYHVRFDAHLPKADGSILYCTTGILLQQLQHAPDDLLDHASHLVIDEVHERSMNIDFLLIVLKKIVAQRIALQKPVPKVILMSATMDSDLFAAYFKDSQAPASQGACPTLSVPGRTFPVKEQYLDTILEDIKTSYPLAARETMFKDPFTQDYLKTERTFAPANPLKRDIRGSVDEPPEDLIIDWRRVQNVADNGETVVSTEREDAVVPLGLVATTIAHIITTSSDGAILVFLPGLDEIVKVEKMLRTPDVLGIDFRDEAKFKIYMLHSSITNGQTEVFQPVPPGCRKIILGTNIAETSITIPDVQYVVDTGKLREKQYDQIRRITKLACTWISKSNSKQRAGRAGRVQNGHYYALFTRERYEAFRAIGTPELLRTDLQETCLDIKAQAFQTPIREFLAAAIEPPGALAVDSAVVNLQKLDALTDDEKLTPLGRLLSSLPVHPSLGKMIVLGVVFRCLDPMLILGAAASERSLFIRPLEARIEADSVRMSYAQNTASDHLALIHAFRELRRTREERGQKALWDFCHQTYTHLGAFKSIDGAAHQIEEVLVEAGLIPKTPPSARSQFQFGSAALNFNSDKVHIIKALALAGLHPNLAVNTGGPLFRTPAERCVMVHPSSINSFTGKGLGAGATLERNAIVTYSSMAYGTDGKSMFLRDTSLCTPLMTCLFGGHLAMSPKSIRILQMDDWLPIWVRTDDRLATKTVLAFRDGLERLLAGAFNDLADKKFLAEDPLRQLFAQGLVRVLDLDKARFDETGPNGPSRGYLRSAVADANQPWTKPMGSYWRRDEASRGRYGDGDGPVPGRAYTDAANMIFDHLKDFKS